MEWRSALIVHEPRGRRKGGGRGGAAGDAHEVHELRELRVGLRVAREPLVVLHVDVPADWQPRRVGGSGCRSLVVMRSCAAEEMAGGGTKLCRRTFFITTSSRRSGTSLERRVLF